VKVRRRTQRNRRGFTIMELLLVVSMIAILATMSLGKSSKILTGWRITRASQTMAEELQQAFALVGRNRRPVIIQFRSDSMTLYMKGRTGIIYRRRYFGINSEYKLKSTDVDFSTTSLEVYPPGLAADSLSIVISGGGVAKRIRMLRGGLVQICNTGAKTTC
jgi:prepilin-type N-terminal cleavage/methylation domain-containing protein